MKIKIWEVVLGTTAIVMIVWLIFGINNFHHAAIAGEAMPTPSVAPTTTQQQSQSWFDSPFFWLWMFNSGGSSNSSYNTSNTYVGSTQSPSASDADTGGIWGSDDSSSGSTGSWSSSDDSGGSWGSDDSGGSWGDD